MICQGFCSDHRHRNMNRERVFFEAFLSKKRSGDLACSISTSTSSADSCSFTFTGKEKDYESGYHYFGARYYDSEALTGWLSVDPETDESPHISAYNYCNSNPVITKDPDGEFPVWVAIGAGVGAAYRAGVAVHERKSALEVVGSAIKGAAEGALIMSGAGALVSTGVSAVADVTSQLIANGSVDRKQVLVSAVGGAISGGAGKVLDKGIHKVTSKATQKIEQKYASAATQKSVRKEVQAEAKAQGKSMGHSTRTQVNAATSTRVQNLKTADQQAVKATGAVVSKSGGIACNAACNQGGSTINKKLHQ